MAGFGEFALKLAGHLLPGSAVARVVPLAAARLRLATSATSSASPVETVVLVVIVAALIIAAIRSFRVSMRSRLTIRSRRDSAVTRRAVSGVFSEGWARVPGGGDDNFEQQPGGAVVMSVSYRPSPGSGTEVEVWCSRAPVKYSLDVSWLVRRMKNAVAQAVRAPARDARPGPAAALQAAELAAFGRVCRNPGKAPSAVDLAVRTTQLHGAGGTDASRTALAEFAREHPQRWELVYQMTGGYQADPAAFLEALARLAGEYGGWVAFGAERLMVDVAGPDLKHPTYRRIMDMSLSFMRANGVPPKDVTGCEWDHWIASGGTIDTWIPPRPVPSPGEAPITDLAPGETRRIAQATSAADSGVIMVRQDSSGRYCEIIGARRSNEDPSRRQREALSSDSLYALYANIGRVLQTPPFWCHSELEPYIPLPRPQI